MTKKVVVFLGPPGSGKGTQAYLLAEYKNWTNISMGRLLRTEKRKGSVLGKKIKGRIDKGSLVSDDLVLEVLKKRLRQKDIKEGIILDGFPRTKKQLEKLDEVLKEVFGSSYELKALFIKVSDPEVKKRLSGRRVCSGCGNNYHRIFKPSRKKGICDVCGGELYRRDDDAEESIEKRLQEFHRNELLLSQEFEKKGSLLQIDGEREIDSIFSQVVKSLKL